VSSGRRHLGLSLLCVALAVSIAGVTACRQGDAREARAPGAQHPATERAVPVSTGLSKVTVGQVRQWMDEGRPLALLDSRSDAAWLAATTKAAGAMRVPPLDVEGHLEGIPRDRTIVVYCT
jgi:hypothetical protein